MVKAKKSIAFLVAMLILITVLPVHAFARYSNTESISAGIAFSGDLATCESKVDGFSGTSKVTITLSLQKQNTDGTYTTIKTWDKVSANDSSLTVRKTYYVERGYSYRTYVEAEVTRDGTTEKVASWSGAVKCG